MAKTLLVKDAGRLKETGRFKKIAFLVPRPDLSLPEFYRYWRGTHGPTVANAPHYAAYRSRYAQNHRLGDGPVGGTFPYPGAAIFHLPGDGSNEAAFSQSSTYRDHIRVDELKFIDMDRTLAMAATERVVSPVTGTGAAKLLIVGRRRDGLGRAAFDERLAEAYGRALQAAPDFAGALRGWVLNHVVEGSFSLPGARPGGAGAIDCIEELWFESEADLADAFSCAGYREHLVPVMRDLYAAADLVSFRAEEIVFFDLGRPTGEAPHS